MSSNHFINPYNFYPLGKKRALSKNGRGINTGVIHYSILTRTPLFVPNTSNMYAFEDTQSLSEEEKAEDRHKSYDFFSYTDLSDHEESCEGEYHKPMIPGSEIRGMLRSNFEILTDSCMSSLETDTVLSKRTNEVFKAGLLKKEGDNYYLYPATDYVWMEDFRKIKQNHHYREGIKLFFDEGTMRGRGRAVSVAKNVSVNDSGREKTGYLMIGEGGVRKEHPHVFVLQNEKGEKVSLKTLELVLKEYEDNARSSNKKSPNKKFPYKEYQEQYQIFKKGKGEKCFPVRYSKIEENVMLSPASITREIYEHKLKNCVKDYQPCKCERHLCPACSLFGTVSDSFAKASRIRFSDLRSISVNGKEVEKNEEYYLKTVILPEMSSPKLNNTEFYLKRPNDAIFWTYDYYMKDGQIFSYEAEINGRKFYWHNMIKNIPTTEENNRNITIRPVKKNVKFEGKLYFSKLTDIELNQLIWLLSIGEGSLPLEKKQHGYKLGAAKPLGLGSIAVQVDNVTLRKVQKEDHGISIVEDTYTETNDQDLFDQDIIKNYMTMTQFDAVDANKIGYPKPKNQPNTEGFRWFVGNHKKYDNTNLIQAMPNNRAEMGFAEYLESMNPKLNEILPEIKCLWVAGYSIKKNKKSPNQIVSKNVKCRNITIYEKWEWLQLNKIRSYAQNYEVLLLPSGTRQPFIDEAMEHFSHVFKAVKHGNKDDDWEKLK